MFIISTPSGDACNVVGRAEAIRVAKSMSLESPRRSIELERSDGRMRMFFRNGELENFVFETRDRQGA